MCDVYLLSHILLLVDLRAVARLLELLATNWVGVWELAAGDGFELGQGISGGQRSSFREGWCPKDRGAREGKEERRDLELHVELVLLMVNSIVTEIC